MNQRKQNRSVWYLMGIALLLAAACVVVSTGTTLARYRAEREEELTFVVDGMEPVYLGTLTYPDDITTFKASEETQWATVNGISQLDFAIANGATEYSCAAESQRVTLRLTGGLGLWNGTEPAAVTLCVPAEPEPEQTEETQSAETTAATEETTEKEPELQAIKATATLIDETSPLYHTFGEGWVFTFQDPEGEELSWTLDGGKFSCIPMKITVDNTAITGESLLQLQVMGEPIR